MTRPPASRPVGRRLTPQPFTPPRLTPVLLIPVLLSVILVVSLTPVIPSEGPASRSGGTAPLAEEPGEGLWAARAAGRSGDYAAALAEVGAIPESLVGSMRPWEDRGPHNVGGRLTDLALAPDGTVVAGSASGGVWTSTDGGTSLQPAWPADLTPAIGAVAVTTADVWLAGTGEANAGGGSLTYGGTGVYRSTNRGATWSSVGLERSGVIARIEPHPTDPDVLWLAAGGDLFGPGGQRGIYRSTDAGRSWALVLAPGTSTAGGSDLAVDPSDPDHLLATMWDRQRTPERRRYGGPGSGTYRSVDGGDTWTPVADLPGFDDDSGRIGVGFSPADPRRVYAVVTRGDGRAAGLWRSDDGDATWRRVDDDPLYEAVQFIFAWWFGKVFPAPEDPDRVLVPGLSLLESVDGGVTFNADGAVHADQHDLVWDPADPQRAVLATDGGMYVSDRSGATLTWSETRVQGFTQLYDVAVGTGDPAGRPEDRSGIAGGFQDLGCRASDASADDWRHTVSCGDGTLALAHPERAGEVILCGQYGRCHRTTELGRQGSRISLPDDDRSAWSTPLIRLPDAPDSLLTGGTRVHRSDDDGRTWRTISADLTSGESPDPDYPFATITALAARPDRGATVAAGTDDGSVWLTTDGGIGWARVASPDRWVTSLAFSPAGALLIGTSGYRAGDPDAQVLRLDDSGLTSLGDGLPQAPVNDLLIIDEGDRTAGTPLVVVATDVGVFLSHDLLPEGQVKGQVGADSSTPPRWRRIGADLPQAPVTSLDFDEASRRLTAGTYGRGIWRTTIAGLTRHAGPDRYATAALIAEAGGTAGQDMDSGGTVLLASGEDFPDALGAAATAAGSSDTTLVLARPDRLPAASRDLLSRLLPARIVVVGGEAAIGEDVADAARVAAGGGPIDASDAPPTEETDGRPIEMARIAGPSRYATAAALAGTAPRPAVVLATAGQPFDALAGAPLAAALGAPVLLVDPDRLPEETARALADLAPAAVVALGGTSAISQQVLDEAVTAAGATSVTRVAGPDRITTAIAIAGTLIADLPGDETTLSTAWLAGASTFPDALAAAATGHPVLLTDRSILSVGVVDALRAIGPTRIRVAGGDAVVGDGVLRVLRSG